MACGRSVQFEFYQRDVTVGMRLAWKLLVVVVSQSFQEVVKAAWKLENTAPSVFMMGFHSSATVDVEHGALWKSRLFRAARPLRIGSLHLSAMWHRPKLWWLSRSERFFSLATLMFVAAPVLVSPPVCCEAGATRSRGGVCDACNRGHVCTCLPRCRVRDSCSHRRLRSSSYRKNSGDNSPTNRDSADLETETSTHRANCAADRCDSPVADSWTRLCQ